jgi:predicted TIM-barrel fold metal-dependent hydrolase
LSLHHSLADLPLRRYRPSSQLRVAEHHVRRARYPVVDAHGHLGRWLSGWVGRVAEWMAPDVGALLETMDRCNVDMIVNLDGRWGQELEANLERYDRRFPGRFATFCHVDWSESTAPGFGERLAASLRASVAVGAQGLKVWKDLGLQVRDRDGNLLLPDDSRLGALWAEAGELGIPVAIHAADPVAFFHPVDERNERLEELLAHPDWSFAELGFPWFARIMEALEALVAAHPATNFIGVHVGGYAENLGWVGRMLATYPNFSVDIAARIAELGRQPRAARDLLLSHPGRVLFGADALPPDPELYAIYFRFLETADEHFPYSPESVPPQGRWAISGLDLPDDVLGRIYSANARRLLPATA